MTIELNITTTTQPARCRAEPAVTPLREKKIISKGIAPNGFRFQFGESKQKIKALVARRIVKKNGSQARIESKTDSSNRIKPIATNSFSLLSKSKSKIRDADDDETSVKNRFKSPSKPKNVKSKVRCNATESPTTTTTTTTTTTSVDSFTEKHTSNFKEPSEDLLLNVCTTPVPQHLNRQTTNRIEKRSENRNGKGGKRVLTEQEIKDGLRQFSGNAPANIHPADKFYQREDEQKSKGEGQSKEPIRSKKTKSNDSKVRKVGLFKDDFIKVELGQRLVKPITEKIFSECAVESLGLHPHAVKNLADLLSITKLTAVQNKTIPQALQGKDLLVRSQTGSGKTLAYALPVVEKLQAIRPKLTRECGIQAVIIVPTRELAIQTYELFQKLIKPYTWLVPGVLMGGERRKVEKARLRKGINILVGTPGRLVDHLLHTATFKMEKAKFLILDEADRLLEMGYERDVGQIVEAINKQREEKANEASYSLEPLQKMLLSATLTAAVKKLAGLTLQEATFIDNCDEESVKCGPSLGGYSKEVIEAASNDVADGDDSTGILTIPENLKLQYVQVPVKLRLVILSGLLLHEYKGKDKFKALIFMSTMEMVNFHHDLLNEELTQKILDEDDDEVTENELNNEREVREPLLKGLRFFKLHGSMSQTERQGVFKGFRECKNGVLLATDVVGRGIDVPEIDLVVQYSPPQKTADFVHRVGRTARAGCSGRAVLFLAPSEVQFVRYLENKRIRISQLEMDTYLKGLNEADRMANTVQEAASNLQHHFEELLTEDREMHEKACKGMCKERHITKYMAALSSLTISIHNPFYYLIQLIKWMIDTTMRLRIEKNILFVD
uniref:ATP-dependent RNA helicase n=1 Tax=Glossina austeni TaxID=7395 RepID=A0A1A9VBZ0_GLOAU